MIANTPETPYYAVIFTSIINELDEEYHAMSRKMLELAQDVEGFLGYENALGEIGISVSYWRDLDAIQKWKSMTGHKIAKGKGIGKWYKKYKVRISKVERDY